ncbi:MAG: hypothetical protein C5B59_19680 [Bacteroidetes bacterium]|nr:MAG: hypothetical protein C5B59_19680 [Bacteroidota bacterium]
MVSSQVLADIAPSVFFVIKKILGIPNLGKNLLAKNELSWKFFFRQSSCYEQLTLANNKSCIIRR